MPHPAPHKVSPLAHIELLVRLGENVVVHPFCHLGVAGEDESIELFIGANSIIRSHSVLYHGSVIGEQFTTGHATLIREFCTIGSQVSIGSHTVLEHHVTVGDRVRIHSNAFIPELTILHDDAWIGPGVVITNADHPRCANIPRCLRGVTVELGAKIGANATVLPGVIIGAGALIGAGSVVTRDVPSGRVYAGNPARDIGAAVDLVCPWDGLTHPYGK